MENIFCAVRRTDGKTRFVLCQDSKKPRFLINKLRKNLLLLQSKIFSFQTVQIVIIEPC